MVSLFTTQTKEVRRTLNIAVKDNGVNYNNLLYFAVHAININAKVRSRNKFLKALAANTWGMDKESFLPTRLFDGHSSTMLLLFGYQACVIQNDGHYKRHRITTYE